MNGQQGGGVVAHRAAAGDLQGRERGGWRLRAGKEASRARQRARLLQLSPWHPALQHSQPLLTVLLSSSAALTYSTPRSLAVVPAAKANCPAVTAAESSLVPLMPSALVSAHTVQLVR